MNFPVHPHFRYEPEPREESIRLKRMPMKRRHPTALVTWMTRFLSISTTLLFSVCLFAQTEKKIGLRCSFWTVFDDNAFRNYQMLSDVVYQPDAVLYYSRRTEQSGFLMDYEGSFTLFKNYSNRKFQHHFIGLSGDRRLGGSGNASLYWGVRGGRRWNESEYAYYNYGTASGYLTLRFTGQKGSVGMGVSSQVQKFKELGQFDFYEIRAHVQPTLTLPTRTTLIGQFQLGYKKFTESVVSQEVIQRTVTMVWNGKGWIRGTGNPNRPKQDSVRTRIIERLITVTAPGKSVLQFTGLGRVAQSIFPGTGIALQAVIRRNLKQDGRFLSFQDSGYEQEDVLFDDPYSYASDEWSFEWTQLLPWNLNLKAGWDWKNKRYSYLAYDAGGNPLTGTSRKDRKENLWMTLKKSVKIKGLALSPVLYVAYSRCANRSNDAYYEYTNDVFSSGLNFSF